MLLVGDSYYLVNGSFRRYYPVLKAGAFPSRLRLKSRQVDLLRRSDFE